MASWCVMQTFKRLYLKVTRINTGSNGIQVYEASSSLFNSCTLPGKKSSKAESMQLLCSKGLCSSVPGTSFGKQIERKKDEELSRIVEAHTIEHVFKNLCLSDTLTPQLITAAFTTLDDLLTKQLLSFSWALVDRYSMIYFQSFVNSETRELHKRVNDNSEFKRLCFEAEKNHHHFTNGQLLAVTQSVLRLTNMNLNDSTFFRLFIECQRHQNKFDLDELSTYSAISSLMRRNGFYVKAYISQRFQGLRPQLGQHVPESSFDGLLNLTYHVGYFMTNEEMNELQQWLCELSEKNEKLTFSWFLRFFDSVTRLSDSINPKLLALMYDRFEKDCETTTAEELHRICTSIIKGNNSCPESVALKIKERADHLFSQSVKLKTSEVLFLVSVYACLRYPGDSMKVLEDALITKIDEMDAVLLKYLSSGTIMYLTQREELLESFYKQILKLKMEIFASPSSLTSIVSCLSKIPSIRRHPSFEQKFSRYVMFYCMNRLLGASYLLDMVRFLTQCLEYFDTRTIESFHEKLLNVIPNLSFKDMLYLASAFPTVTKRYYYTPSFAKYQPEHYPSVLIGTLVQQILMRKDEFKNLTQVNHWVSLLDNSNSSYIRENNEQICEMYAKLVVTSDFSSILRASHFLKGFRFNVPQVLDRMSSTLLGSSSFLNLKDMTQSIKLLAYFNHDCNNIENLGELYLNKVGQLGNDWKGSVGLIVSGANHLATLQIYSEKLLSFIFSVDFLTQLDETIENDPNDYKKHYAKTRFLELNRAILLQCPHIPVPWISSSLTQKSFKLYEFITKSWQISIYEGLLHHFGGVDYVKVGPLTTEYGHLYDFECALDINRVPVPIDSPMTHYKIAVLLLKPNNFSSNDNKLIGPSINLITQLEILGFTVIQVPFFELQKMKKKNVQSKMQYFEDLLITKCIKKKLERTDFTQTDPIKLNIT